jgi:hypothetical protein
MAADFGMRSLSDDSGSNLHHVHIESLCETVSDFLDTLDGTEPSAESPVQGRLSESEVAILECGLIVADIKNIADDIDVSFISKLENDKNELIKLFGNLERISDQVLPQLDEDLNAIQELVDGLDVRFRSFQREQSIGWIKKFLPTGPVKARDEHAKYAHQIAMCKLHSADALLQCFEEPISDVASSISNSSGSAVLDSPDSGNGKGGYEAL